MNGRSARWRAAWRVLWRSRQLETDMRDEMRFHVEMEAERLVRDGGLDLQEARRLAHVLFGGVEKFKEEGRDARGRQWLDALTVDARLGVRMLVKHRGLTLVGGFAMAVAIAIGATFFEVTTEMLNRALPLEDGERVVSLQGVSTGSGSPAQSVLNDFVAWRDELVSIEQLAVFRTAQRNLVSAGAPPEPVKIAEITASGFGVARTPPLVGRYLLPEDEREGAPAVIAIGHQVWQSRFAGDREIVGRTINLGGLVHTIVGVMPDGFAFPYDHQFWTPLRATPLADEQSGPRLHIFGRLAPGVTIEEAQAELTTVVQRAVAERPDTQPRLRPVVAPYTRAHVDLTHPTLVWMLRVAQLVVGALSFVVAVNLAILMYARMVTRLGEIAVRTALGASRRRILMQLFIEAFALTAAGAATGLMLANVALSRMQSMARMNGGVPFWIHFELSIGTVAFAAALATGAAVIMGVLPGLKATGQRLTVNLYEMNGRTGTRLGPIWTTLVVAQVGVAVAVLPMAVYMAWQVVQLEIAGAGFAAERFVVATAALGDGASPSDAGGVRRRQLELMSRVAAEPAVSAVTFSSSVPGFSGSRHIRFEGGVEVQDESALDVSTFDVALDLFDVYNAELLAGRVFTSADLGPAGAAIVNETFAQRFLGSRSPLGVRFRYSSPLLQQPGASVGQKSYQIVGVVRDFPRFPPAMSVDREPVVYHPAAPGDVHPFVVSARFAGAIPAGFIDRFRQIAAEVDPALQLRRVVPLTEFYDQLRAFWRYIAWGIGLVTTSVLLLSAAGIYALTSFTVAQRTREIGIRVALGAHPRRLLAAIFARVLCQFALGLLAGSLVSAAVFSSLGLALEQAAGLLLAVAAIMLTVGVVSALAPARRSLRAEATDALRAEI